MRLIPTQGYAVLRKAFVMMLNPRAEEEYIKRHNPIWPELQAVLIEHGVATYSIFHMADTGQLFAYVEVEDEARWNAIAQTPVCQTWWRHMAELMKHNEDQSPTAVSLPEVFHL